ncbi:HEXXH motif-containing putative peptide modification protein [Streptomyces sp. NBC_00268]|uniref:aKG-HExxH-type peptide beta-hydroxylase n=1 Tax=Streptomyces sp. NBC_00268 TaxID=2975695 RepID=UPI0022514B6C|nr:HEXXH motif-containing putative peptide modification protein [Streptomyces sp. NBC_00268]MCX5185507.1 HEXXH motif-containing putative peptide modification protein [Streptomyces sp. NBC_00268]
MSAEPSPPHHHLPSATLAELARGEGGPATLDLLLEAERSRRLLLLRMLDDAMGPGPAWDLLSEAQRRSPSVVDELLMYPQTGMWLATALRRLRGSIPQDEPLWVVLGHFSALAAVAALRAELDFSIEVPVRHGRVPLPTLGCAVLPTTEPWTTATVRSEGGRTVVETADATIAVPPGPGSAGPGWHEVRRLAVGPTGRQLDVALDDLDPYRTYPQPTEPRPLSEEAVTQWRKELERAWRVLLRELPGTAEAMRRGVFSLTPTPARERFRPRSVTSGDAFGGIEASEPDDAVQLAVTLVHEFQHTKLGGLLHLTPLLTDGADVSTELWYAPWRDDPRPLDGLLQGIYAFVGIARFWRAHREKTDAQKAIAHFEFALWRTHVATALEQVHRHPRRTPLGAALLDTLRGHCAQWLEEPVPEEQLALARLCAADHVARWRVHHLRPPAPAVEEAVRAWLAGASGPPVALAAEPDLVPDLSARWLDSMAMLARHHLSTTPDERPPSEDPDKAAAHVTGALPGDALLAAGDATAAQHAYRAHLAVEPGRAGAWAGLGHALKAAGTEPAAAHLLCHWPERARAVHQALLRATGAAPDPVRLAAWLASPTGSR